ncbi:hypothetical protein SAXI111661_21260 [Saccharomonospora xinjiangensis]|uniref:hypothetical protein n=1 Tax=Saccharomonospora xinjiangensis TaxID=75294 RepID=UPI00106F3C6E|nr:hypothetical protein [Saccharomonospora xinjiangensis]QBQ59179.1 hypothetical protein EYD13_04000 [Saccharomonospora xinjiangensis]
MGKKWGKRRKSKSPVVVPQAFDAAFGISAQGRQVNQPPGRAPASSTPLADRLSVEAPGITDDYVVLPRSLAENMPLPWQQQMAALLAQFHETHRSLSWPAYRVVPSRPERLVDLDEEQLAEAGYLVELDTDGEMVYRDRSGRRVDEPANTVVLVPCLDPIVREPGGADDRGERGAGKPGAAPMNIGPQPVWRTAPAPATTPTAPTAPVVPPLPPPPTAPSLAPPPVAVPEPVPMPGTPGPPPASPGPGPGDRGWFDDLEDETTASRGGHGDRQSEPPPEVKASASEAQPEFGPTGDEPTEIPYRYRH